MNTQNYKSVSVCLICFLLLLPKYSQAQMPNSKFRVVNREISVDNKSKIVSLNEIDGVGIAWILDEQLTEGEIEFDVKGIDKYQGSFLGLAFHGTDDKTYEAVYFRPFNFRVDDTLRRLHAVQYMSNPNYDWPVLREQFAGKYEKAMPNNIDPNDWFHVKLVILSDSISVYINRHSVPVLETNLLGQKQGKMIGYWVGNGSGGEWKNLSIRKR